MLTQIADGVLVHESAFLQSQAVVVEGRDGVLLIDPGVQDFELACLANDLAARGHTVTAGFSTHPHWDHLLWHPDLGPAPRYGTALCAATASQRLSDPAIKARLAGMIPPDIAPHVPLDLISAPTGLPAGATHIPWDGPEVRILEHRAHAPGHAALLIEKAGVLVAGDLLSDVLDPILDPTGTIDDYLDALNLLESVDADVVVPGHGSIADAPQKALRIDHDRTALLARS